MSRYSEYDDFKPFIKEPLLPINNLPLEKDPIIKSFDEPRIREVTLEKDYEAQRRAYYEGGHKIISQG